MCGQHKHRLYPPLPLNPITPILSASPTVIRIHSFYPLRTFRGCLFFINILNYILCACLQQTPVPIVLCSLVCLKTRTACHLPIPDLSITELHLRTHCCLTPCAKYSFVLPPPVPCLHLVEIVFSEPQAALSLQAKGLRMAPCNTQLFPSVN